MKAKDIQVGKIYWAKVSGSVQPVKITEIQSYGGWGGINLNTRRAVYIRGVQRLRREVTDRDMQIINLERKKGFRSDRSN